MALCTACSDDCAKERLGSVITFRLHAWDCPANPILRPGIGMFAMMHGLHWTPLISS